MSRPNAQNDLCSSTERWFSEKGRTRIPSDLRQHLLRCSECRSEYSDGLPLSRLVDLPSLQEPRAYGPEPLDRRRLRDAVMASIECENSRVTRRASSRAWRAAALFLVSTVLFAAGYRFLAGSTEGSRARSASSAVSRVEARDGAQLEASDGRGSMPAAQAEPTPSAAASRAVLADRPPFLVGVDPIEPSTPYPVVEVASEAQGEVVTF